MIESVKNIYISANVVHILYMSNSYKYNGKHNFLNFKETINKNITKLPPVLFPSRETHEALVGYAGFRA